MTLSVNEIDKTIHINQNGIQHIYHFKQIAFIEKHLAIYDKNKVDNKRRFYALWSEYGYMKIKFNDGNTFHFTSLMLTPSSFDIGVPFKTKFRGFPYLGGDELSITEERKIIEKLQREKIDEYKTPLLKLSTQELQKKIDTKEKFAKEAIMAAEEILKERDAESSSA